MTTYEWCVWWVMLLQRDSLVTARRTPEVTTPSHHSALLNINPSRSLFRAFSHYQPRLRRRKQIDSQKLSKKIPRPSFSDQQSQMADDQVAEIPDTSPVPEMVACQCRSTYHWRQGGGSCPNPARWCQWCKDGGCVVARRADAARERREARRSSRNSSRHDPEGRSRRRGHERNSLPMPPTVPFPMLPPLLPMPGMPFPLPWPGAGDASSSESSDSSISSSDGSFDDIRRDPRRMGPQFPRHPWM